MNVEHLVKMANQIGAFFDALPDRDEAVAGVANHLQRTWEPRMRAELLAYAERADGGALTPIVRAALQAHRDKLG
ncbi:MAG: formate dehydrogenase subunit delta [Rhodocyclales bacterium]|nr:formate dehydrogenase subunit delta [Rhodocyclales bacterium]